MSQTRKPNQKQDTSSNPEGLDNQSPLEKGFSVQPSYMTQLLNALTNEVSALIAAINLDYQYTYFNPAYHDEIKRLTGVNLVPGMTVMDLYHDTPEQLAFSLKQWNRPLGGKTFKEVIRFPRIETSANFYEASYSPVKNEQGIVTGAVVVSKNLTRRSFDEHFLTESEMRYQQLFDNIADGLAICQFLYNEKGLPIDYRILDVNLIFSQLLGTERERIIGSTYSSLAPSIDFLSVDRLSEVAKNDKNIHFEAETTSPQRYYEVYTYRLSNSFFAIILSDITTRKSNQEINSWLASFPELNPMPVLEIDYDGSITYQNPASVEFFPSKSEDHRPHPFPFEINDILENCKKGDDQGIYKDVLIGNNWLHLSFYHIPQRKRIRIYSIDITMRVNAENELLELNRKLEETVSLRTEELNRLNNELKLDILRQKKTETALKVERKRFNDVLEVLPAYVVLLSPESHISFANKFFKKSICRSRGGQCNELSCYRTNPGEVVETFKPLQTGQPNIWEWVGPDNRIYIVHDYPFTDTDGSPLVLEMGLDITEIRIAEEKLQQTANYNRSLIEANLDFLVTIDKDGVIGDVNTAAERATGLSREELIGSRFENYFENADLANKGVQLVLEKGSVRDYELSIRHKDGHTTPVAYNASFYTDSEGKIGGIFAGARELTELRKKENQLLELNQALKESIEHEAAIHDQLVQTEKFAAMGRMLASVTHEINNPLQTISNCLYLIASDIPAESPANQFLTMAMSETGRISKLVAELKEVYRPRQENAFAPVHLPKLLDEVHNLIKPQLTEKKVEWDLIADSKDLEKMWVNGMVDQLKQVFLNLSMNAIEAMQLKGGQLQVTLIKENKDEIGVIFSDTGPGIDPANISKIFEPFFSTKDKGLGLGLSICYDIIQRHQGHMDVSSMLGKGSTFEVWLPELESQKHLVR